MGEGGSVGWVDSTDMEKELPPMRLLTAPILMALATLLELTITDKLLILLLLGEKCGF